MKCPIATIGLAVFGFIFSGCHAPPQPNDQQAIASVLAQKESAGVDCEQILIDGRQIMKVQLHGSQFLAAIKKNRCDRVPRAVSRGVVRVLRGVGTKLKSENAQEDTLDLISMWKGEIGDLPAIGRRLEAYDTEPAWQRCEQAALEYGVQAAATTAR